METKKSNRASLENKRGLYFKIGLTFTLFIVLCAFEWKFYTKENNFYNEFAGLIPEDQTIITVQKDEIKQLKPKPPAIKFEIVDNNVKTDSTTTIFTSEITNDTTTLWDIKLDTILDVEDILQPYQVEKQPMFKGGDEAMYEWIKNNVVYPKVPKDEGITGKVYINFVVNKDGSISNVKVERPIDYYLDKEAIRLISAMPNWIPGSQNGKAVPVRQIIPIKFVLGN